MTISSRTPEGRPNHCPVCGHELMIEPSIPPGDAPCPTCGHLLWFGEGGTVRDVAGVAVRRRMLKAGVVLVVVVLVLALFIFGVPGLSPIELTVIVALAAILFGARIFQAFNRARRFWPFRRR